MKKILIFGFLMTVFFMLFASATFGQLKTTTIAPVEYINTPFTGNFAPPPKKYDPNGYRHDYLIRIGQQNLYMKISTTDVLVRVVRAGETNPTPGNKVVGGYLKYVLYPGEYRIVVKPGPQAFTPEKPRRTSPGVYGPATTQKKSIEYRITVKTTPWDKHDLVK